MRRFILLVIPTTCLIALTACSSVDNNADVTTYVQPAWMAEQRAIGEQYDAEMLNCLETQGVTGTVGKNGGVSIIFETPNGEEVPDDVLQIQQEALEYCGDEVPIPASWTKAIDEESYQQIVDVTECIKAEGVAIESPPSMSSWLETARNNPDKLWSPYISLADSQTISYPEIEDLMSVCQQQPFAGLDIGITR